MLASYIRKDDPIECQLGKIKLINKDIDRPNRVVLVYPVFRAFGKQRRLPAIHAFNEALHLILPQIARESYPENLIQRCVFTQPGSLATEQFSPSAAFCPLLV